MHASRRARENYGARFEIHNRIAQKGLPDSAASHTGSKNAKELAVTTPRKAVKHPKAPISGGLSEENFGEQLLREACDGQGEFVAGWNSFTEAQQIQGTPIGAKKLRALFVQAGIRPEDNEFSRGIVSQREE